MITTATAPDQLTRDLDRLGRMVRTAGHYIDAVRWWAGYPLRGHPAGTPASEPLAEADAILLDLPPGTVVLRREIHLVSSMAGHVEVVATVTELVHEPLLGSDPATRRELHEGARPVDTIVDGIHRAAYLLTRGQDADDDDAAMLISRAILSGAGRPLAITTETVHRRLLTRRAPATIPHYAARVPTPARILP